MTHPIGALCRVSDIIGQQLEMCLIWTFYSLIPLEQPWNIATTEPKLQAETTVRIKHIEPKLNVQISAISLSAKDMNVLRKQTNGSDEKNTPDQSKVCLQFNLSSNILCLVPLGHLIGCLSNNISNNKSIQITGRYYYQIDH